VESLEEKKKRSNKQEKHLQNLEQQI